MGGCGKVVYVIMVDETDVVVCGLDAVTSNTEAGMRIFGIAGDVDGASELVGMAERE